jgi:N-acetylglutamate synthase-like GNAT family acetyltransferase
MPDIINEVYMNIRSARETDLEKILSLQKIAYRQEAEIYDDYDIPPLKQSLDELKNEFDNKIILVAEINNEIIGSVRAEENNKTCFIGRLIVLPAYQNKGIGTRLMKEIENMCGDIERYELFTGEKSEKNIYLYKKLGYRIFKTEKLSDNVNIIFMEKLKKGIRLISK